MDPEPHLFFAPFRLDRASERLWRGEERLALRPKTFALLRYLAEHPERLVSQAELLQAVWKRSFVSDGLLRGYVRELREVLGDDAKAPRFIETAARRGYRFIAPVTRGPPMPALNLRSPPADASPFVGREAELARLQTAFEQAVGGQRQFVFVTGEPGLGKTALLDTFLSRNTRTDGPWIACGQCVETYGAAEACLPILEAVGRLARGTRGRGEIVPILRRLAPAWLLHMPALIEEAELAELQRSAYGGATHERMVRELAEALEALSRVHPLVLCLEDLHWSDNSTVDLLAMLGRRREPAHLLVVGSYRPGEASASMHPLRALARGLLADRHCAELALRGLTVPEVGEYLSARFGLERHVPAFQAWARVIHEQSDGNALFMVAMVTDLVLRDVIRDAAGVWSLPARPEAAGLGLPESLRQFLEGQLERLGTEDRRVLETASVAGMGFSAALLAAVMETDVDQVEECCEMLVRRQLLLRAGDGHGGPERRGSERYAFLHAVYRRVLYERLTVARRIRLHRRIGDARERAYGDRAQDIGAELAMHFEQGQDYRRAVQYLHYAAENGLRRSANPEAIGLLTKGLELLKTLPDTPERTQQELRLQVALSASLAITKGYAAPEVESAYTRARALCQEVGETHHLLPVLYGIWRFYLLRADFQTAYQQGEQVLELAQRTQDTGLLLTAHMTLEATLFYRGEFVRARAHLEQGRALYDPQQHRALSSLYGDDPGVVRLTHGAQILWHLGYPDQALESIDKALTLVRDLSHPFSLAFALFHAAMHHMYRREGQAAQERAEALIALSNEQGFPAFLAQGLIFRGGALAAQGRGAEGIEQIRQGLALCQATGQALGGRISVHC